MTPKLFIAYYRVSTDKQGERGLGIQAQRATVDRFIEVTPDAVLYAAFTEVVSATNKKVKVRPVFDQARALAQQVGASLVIAKLDRMTRDMGVMHGLMESRLPFHALDMPFANKLTIYIMTAFAEHEADRISERTSEAIQARLKDPNYRNAKGARWGNPQCLNPKYRDLSKTEAAAARRQDAIDFAKKMEPIIRFYLQDHHSFNSIARELTRLQHPTASGKQGWTPTGVKNLLGWLEEA